MSSALSSIVLLFLISVLIVENSAVNSCKAQVYLSETCSTTVSVPNCCNSGIFNLTNTNYAKCNTMNVFWSYPRYNLTLIIETAFTQQHQ
ncbi:unnamed protein product [Rotaria sp. Silwood1]|nr:unnamed protein product [Rotaria sp. Silwood1]CAF1490357.1 unnamed protein product [Rotaria sp. Silwood1]CAF3596454.1 unnamed protein product [Rotaria sp. Silwood1]CAF3732573.1 unnamed protein product [Rotaria sp. Silwood1]CAF4876320.1 unnamed protein product [Rotaria sp. Silwood1]